MDFRRPLPRSHSGHSLLGTPREISHNNTSNGEIHNIISAHLTLLQSRLEAAISERERQLQDSIATLRSELAVLCAGGRVADPQQREREHKDSWVGATQSDGDLSSTGTVTGSPDLLQRDATAGRGERRKPPMGTNGSLVASSFQLLSPPHTKASSIGSLGQPHDGSSGLVVPLPSTSRSNSRSFLADGSPTFQDPQHSLFSTSRRPTDLGLEVHPRRSMSPQESQNARRAVDIDVPPLDGRSCSARTSVNEQAQSVESGDDDDIRVEAETREVEDMGDYGMFELWPIWKHQPKSYADRVAKHWGTNTTLQKATMSHINLSLEESDDIEGNHHSRCVINPVSRVYLIWNILFVLVLGYELVSYPLQVFELPENTFERIALGTATFWTVDLVLSFFLGYFNRGGRLVLSHCRIVRHYARTWMVPDLMIVLLDWMTLSGLAEGGLGVVGVARVGKVLRYTRLLRAVRLLRLRKLLEAMHTLDDFINSQAFSICKQLVLNVLAIIVIAHFIACLWYLIGTTNVTGYDSWVSYYNFRESEWEYAYWSSLHWSLTQFTPGSMNVQPQNSLERFYAVVVLILGLLIFSSIVGNITTATNNLKNMNAWYGKQIWLLRKYFREKRISPELLRRVRRFTDVVIQPKQSQVKIEDISLLPMLPESLRMEVLLELYRSHLEIHPFFNEMIQYSRRVMQKICRLALSQQLLTQDDELFSPGQTAYAMYFLLEGRLEYTMEHIATHTAQILQYKCPQTSPPKPQDMFDEVDEDRRWFCEAVLWTPWVHQGRMKALSETDVLALDAETFQKVVTLHRADAVFPRTYGEKFVHLMNEYAGFFQEEGPRSSALDRHLSDLMEAGPVSFMAVLTGHGSTDQSSDGSSDFSI